MAKRTTTNDLATAMKTGFDAQGKQIDDLATAMKTGFDAQGKQIADLTIAMKEGFDAQGKEITELKGHVTVLKEEVFQNGDALAKFIVRFEDESAANLTAHERIETRLERMEHKTDLRLNRIEHRLDLAPIPFPTN